MTRIRSEMAEKGGALLQGIIEADETYIGGNLISRGNIRTKSLQSVDEAQRKRLCLELFSVEVKSLQKLPKDLQGGLSLRLSGLPLGSGLKNRRQYTIFIDNRVRVL